MCQYWHASLRKMRGSQSSAGGGAKEQGWTPAFFLGTLVDGIFRPGRQNGMRGDEGSAWREARQKGEGSCARKRGRIQQTGRHVGSCERDVNDVTTLAAMLQIRKEGLDEAHRGGSWGLRPRDAATRKLGSGEAIPELGNADSRPLGPTETPKTPPPRQHLPDLEGTLNNIFSPLDG
jgi:hypothetical protein